MTSLNHDIETKVLESRCLLTQLICQLNIEYLMNVFIFYQQKKHQFALSLISYIGISISILALSISFLTFAFLRWELLLAYARAHLTAIQQHYTHLFTVMT